MLVALLLLAATAAPTAEELIARNLDAHGGAARLHALKSLRLTGKALFGDADSATELEWSQLVTRPGRIRTELTQQGLTSVEAFDGAEAWRMDPFGGRRDPVRGSADDVRDQAQDADLEGPLLGLREKGHSVELLGLEDVDGTPAWKLRLVLKDGDVKFLWLDPDTFLEIRELAIKHRRGVERPVEIDYGNYGLVGGVVIAFAIEAGAPNQPRQARFIVEQAEANVDAKDSLFRYPAPGEKVLRSIVAGPPSMGIAAAPRRPQQGKGPVLDAGIVSGLGVRNIGSATMSGRVAALAARTENGKTLVYVGAASGGVWRSQDGGTTFKPVFDKQPVQSIGALALDPQDSRIVWAGTGEGWTRNSTSIGNGIYKSTDGGETWGFSGLPKSERIVRIVVHPKDGNTVYACVPGKLWSDSPDRGLYKTTDGGKSWDLILTGGNLSTGCSSVTMDAQNPDVLLAGLWDFRRKGWTFRSGGDGPDAASGSGLFRSVDGGQSWTELSQGLSKKPWGRVEVALAPSNPKIAYALVESTDSALYRSDDGGLTWQQRDKSQMMVWRPFYFARLVVDPKNPERVFKAGGGLIVSEDGGRSFSSSNGGAHGDWHDVWIDPENTRHTLGADDGGFWISHDGGSRWWKVNNLPISQFYHVAVNDQDPYEVFGGLQDNSSWVGPSSYPGGISTGRWENLYGGDGFWVQPDPTDPDAAYAEAQGGYVGRVDRRTLTQRDIQPKAGYHEKLRFNWNAPLVVSPTQKNTLYIGAQFLFRSRDKGDSWERISPDLTTNDPAKQKQEESGGVTVDNSSAEMHTTIYAISESPLDAQQLWVGTDDGNVQLTRDGGKSWVNTAPALKGLPRGSWVSWVEASRYDKGTAYAVFDRHTSGDFEPWVFRTTDFGKTWARLPHEGVRGHAWVIREDLKDRALLFLGTELGLFISVDAGKTWAEFRGNDFPSVAVRDLALQAREDDLVIATHGRGIWIIDDLAPLRALTPQALQAEAAFLPSRPSQQRLRAQGGWVEGDATFVGQNPPGGAVIAYYQRSRHVFGELKLEIFDEQGKLVDTVPASKRRGLNRVIWSMQVKPPRVPRAAQLTDFGAQAPRVLPGTYTVRLTKNGQVVETKLVVQLDRRASFDLAARKQQFDAAMKVHGLFGEMTDLTDRLDTARAALDQRAAALPAGDELKPKLGGASDQLGELKKKIVATKEGGAITGEERLREHLDHLYGALLSWEGKPGSYHLERLAVLQRELSDVRGEIDSAMTGLKSLDAPLKSRKLEPIPQDGPHASLPGGAPACWFDGGCRATH